jgi:hypothetical protein
VIARYRVLASRLRDEVSALDSCVEAIGRHWRGFKSVQVDQDAYLNSVAFGLQSFYSSIERVLELVAGEMDGGTLGGESWHAELLHQMATDVPGVRPHVLERGGADWLDEYRKFRHRARNIYATNLVPYRVEPLVAGLTDGWPQLRSDFVAFAEFLDNVA